MRGESTRLLPVNEVAVDDHNLVELFISGDERYSLKCFRFACLILGPLIMIPFMFGILDNGNLQISRCAGVTLWMAIWWMSEATAITVTSLLPLVIFPMMGLLPPSAVAKSYFSDLSFLLIGTICFSIAMAKWNLHKRFALKILTVVGTNPSAVMFGFMFCTYFTSWWLQNTATTVMMLPVARAVLESINASSSDRSTPKFQMLNAHENRGDMYRFSTAILLSVAYSSSIGGLATITGTGTNLVFAAQVRNLFPAYGEISFALWMAYCAPLSFFLLLVMWVIFYIKYTRGSSVKINSAAIQKKYNEMGPMTFEEMAVGFFLLLTIVLWIMRNPPGCSETEGCGWEELFHPYREWYGSKNAAILSDTTAVLFTALFLFFIPARNGKKAGAKLLEWEEAQEGIPWEILLLIGGGLTIAESFSYNGFNDYIALKLVALDGLPPYVIALLVCLAVTTLTEFTSSTAVASITLPVIASLAVAIRVHPFFLMMPAVMTCSFSFCLPVATPPNAMVARSGGVRVAEMLKAGIWMNLAAIMLNFGWLFLAKGILGINLNEFPSWAEPN